MPPNPKTIVELLANFLFRQQIESTFPWKESFLLKLMKPQVDLSNLMRVPVLQAGQGIQFTHHEQDGVRRCLDDFWSQIIHHPTQAN